MTCGAMGVGDEVVSFGFWSVKDWFYSILYSFPAPWGLQDLSGKYYGTVILDARGKRLLSVWEHDTYLPSRREKAAFGDWTPEAWAEYNCDEHYESEWSLAFESRLHLFGG